MAPRRVYADGFVRGFRRLDSNAIKKHHLPVNSIPKRMKEQLSLAKLNSNDKCYERLMTFFEPIPAPLTEFDWLAMYREKGQSLDEFVKYCPIEIDEKKLQVLGNQKYIYYIKLGEFKQTKLNFDDLIEYSGIFFSPQAIKLMPNVMRIESKVKGQSFSVAYGDLNARLTSRYDSTSKRMQLKASSLFRFLKRIQPDDALCLIAFTEYDLYCDDEDLFVAGLCDGDKGVGVFSCLRYDPALVFSVEHWFDMKKARQSSSGNDRTTLLTRSCKLLVHETCHLLGIEHCTYFNCCMNGSGNIEEDFRQSMFLCPVDLKKVSLLINVNILERYTKMREFFVKHNSKSELKWLDKTIKALQE